MVLWVGGWLVGGGCDVIFNITEGGGLELFFCFGGGVLSTLVFQPPLLIIIAQSLTRENELILYC